MRLEGYAEMFNRYPHTIFRTLREANDEEAAVNKGLGREDEDRFMRQRELALRVTGLSEEEIDRAMAPMRSFLLTVRGE